MNVDAVGLLRAEFIIAHLGEHPRSMLESGRGEEYTQHLVHELERFESAFHPRPVVYRFSDFKLWMMVDPPSNFLLLGRFLGTGIDGVSIGSNDLTQLVLGMDRDIEQLAEMCDEHDPAVLQANEHLLRTCAPRGATVSICRQGPLVY